jgi:hypothetical protein
MFWFSIGPGAVRQSQERPHSENATNTPPSSFLKMSQTLNKIFTELRFNKQKLKDFFRR